MSVDKLESMNKEIDRCVSSLASLCRYLTATAHSYTKEKHGRQLKECNEKIEELEEQIKDLNLELEKVRDNVRLIDKEIGESSIKTLDTVTALTGGESIPQLEKAFNQPLIVEIPDGGLRAWLTTFGGSVYVAMLRTQVTYRLGR